MKKNVKLFITCISILYYHAKYGDLPDIFFDLR